LRNDTIVPPARLLKGITITCDQTLAPNAGGTFPPPSLFPNERAAAKPTCFVTLDLPYPIGGDTQFWDFNQIVGFQPLILGGQAQIAEQNILWLPSEGASQFLRILLQRLRDRQIADHVLAHLTIKGNFIFAPEDANLNLDGDVFGRPRGSDRIDIDLPSGDNRRGGDLEMWFWLAEEAAPTPPGLNLSVTVVPGPVGTTANTIRGTVLDTNGAAVPGAVVTLTGANLNRTATTNAQGAFSFTGLPPGTFRISVQMGALSAEQTVTI
jgi:hypothetical protein